MSNFIEKLRDKLEQEFNTGELNDAVDCLNTIQRQVAGDDLEKKITNLGEVIDKFLDGGNVSKNKIQDMTDEIDGSVVEIIENAEKIQAMLNKITTAYEEVEDEEEEDEEEDEENNEED